MKPLLYKLGYAVLRCYWFIFRPETQGVKCLILSGEEILLVRHTYGKHSWTLPGGGVKKGESNQEAASREVKEELGLRVMPEYIGEFTHNTDYKIDTVFCFVAHIKKLTPTIDPGEIQEAEWWKLNELPAQHSTGLDRVLGIYRP